MDNRVSDTVVELEFVRFPTGSNKGSFRMFAGIWSTPLTFATQLQTEVEIRLTPEHQLPINTGLAGDKATQVNMYMASA